MNKYFQLVFLSAALLLAGCSNDIETPATVKSGTGAIAFNTRTSKQLRAATTLESLGAFLVSSWDADGNIKHQHDQINVSASGECTYQTGPAPDWPSGDTRVDFFALSPIAPNGVSGTLLEVTENVVPTITYETPASLSDMQDLLLARNFGTFNNNVLSGVDMGFRHVLSRIVVNVTSPETMDFVVDDFSFENIGLSSTLPFDSVPMNTDPLAYPATANGTRRTMWTKPSTQTGSISAEIAGGVRVEAKQTVNLIGEASGKELYVIPQQTVYDASLTKITDAAEGKKPTGFYLKITYHPALNEAQPKTWQIPVADLLSKATTSIAFEVERQYTFNVNILSSGRIEFSKPEVAAFQNRDTLVNDAPKQDLIWAGSNIYWDDINNKMTFAAQDDKGIDTKKYYQGLYFKWGSLIGVSPCAPATYYEANKTTSYSFGDLPLVDNSTYPLSTFSRDRADLGGGFHDPYNKKGDICKYLSDIGNAPGNKKWRMPTSQEFEAAGDYVKEGGGTLTTSDVTGKYQITSGYFYKTSTFFPNSGYRNSDGTVGGVGTGGYYYTSSANSTANAYRPSFASTLVLDNAYTRTAAYPVRCVQD